MNDAHRPASDWIPATNADADEAARELVDHLVVGLIRADDAVRRHRRLAEPGRPQMLHEVRAADRGERILSRRRGQRPARADRPGRRTPRTPQGSPRPAAAPTQARSPSAGRSRPPAASSTQSAARPVAVGAVAADVADCEEEGVAYGVPLVAHPVTATSRPRPPAPPAPDASDEQKSRAIDGTGLPTLIRTRTLTTYPPVPPGTATQPDVRKLAPDRGWRAARRPE